jgi:NADH-quinone oxidoreductase subunit C
MEKKLLAEKINEQLGSLIKELSIKDLVTLEVDGGQLTELCKALRDEELFKFEMLVDLCGVDYLDYGYSHWRGEETTVSGFSRGFNRVAKEKITPWNKPRFAVVYHLLSITHNHRVRLKVFCQEVDPIVPTVINIWSSANWYEREAYDLYGIIFEGHPDLRRLLTDYGFIGHPFRKDFPLIGELELRYDAAQGRCIYEPVSIQPRTLVPKVIRKDTRYQHTENEEGSPYARGT